MQCVCMCTCVHVQLPMYAFAHRSLKLDFSYHTPSLSFFFPFETDLLPYWLDGK